MVVKGTFNAFSRHGCIVRDPSATIRLKGTDEEYGIDVPDLKPLEAAEFLTMRADNVGMSEAAKRVRERRPVLVLRTDAGEREVDSLEGLA